MAAAPAATAADTCKNFLLDSFVLISVLLSFDSTEELP
jgi:hypothetical protein